MSAPSQDLQALIGSEGSPRWWARPSLWLVFALLAALAAGAWIWQRDRSAAATPRYLTEPVTRGRLVVTVAANGTLVPTNKVDVGSELSGTVARVNVDVNDRVKKGQVLAELDTARLSDQVERSRAALAAAKAAAEQAAATLEEARGNLGRLQEVARLSNGQVPSRAELAAGEAALARAQAALASAKAGVVEAGAAASSDETNLRKAFIRSPIDGVVLSRNVDPGNAVAASLQAVTLFTLAENLGQMKLQVNVDEADVGQVREGQRASFTVSAWPSRSYPATVTRVSYGSTTKDNVVTYVTELSVSNEDLSLRPGMTASAVIAANERDNVLLVPNAALRYSPATAAQAPAASGTSIVSRLVPRPPRSGQPRRAGTSTAAVRELWVLQDGQAVQVPVTPGASDGRMTEVSGERLREGMAVIVDQASGTAK